MEKRLTMLIHGDSGLGKSRLLDTAPGPRLLIDAEAGADWLPSPQIQWDPAGPPPQNFPDGSPITTDTTVVVTALDWQTVELVYTWLASGQHYFESVALDSLTEIQKKAKDAIGGQGQFSENMWGQLLTKMEIMIRQLRDLKKHPTKPVNVFISALTKFKDEKYRPNVQGALIDQMPQYMDVVGFFHVAPTEGGVQRQILISPHPQYIAKDRTDLLLQKFGPVVATSVDRTDLCTLACMVDVLNGRQ